jgi:hypothetical protein
MKYLFILLLMLVGLAGCIRLPSKADDNDYTLTSVATVATNTKNGTLTITPPTLTPTSTLYPSIPIALKWELSTLQFKDVSVCIEYPAEWQVFPNPHYDMAYFAPSDNHGLPRNYYITIAFYDHPAPTDPSEWETENSNYIVQWKKPITIADLYGLEFAWGRFEPDDPLEWEGCLDIMAMLYSEQNSVEIQISTSFDDQSLELLPTLGFDKVVNTRFGLFEHMMNSISICSEAPMR